MRSPLTRHSILIFMLLMVGNVTAYAINVSPSSLTVNVGSKGKVTVSRTSGTVRVTSSKTSVASVTYSNRIATVIGVNAGEAEIKVKDSKSDQSVKVRVIGSSNTGLSVSPASLSLNAGTTGSIAVSNPSGSVSVTSSDATVTTGSYANNLITVKAIKIGSAVLTIKDSTKSIPVSITVTNVSVPPPVSGSGNYTLLAWNDLGMHCMDGVDFSVFTILPPYNTLHAQLKDKAGKLINTGVNMTYEAIPDSAGSINTYSAGKTNFWQNSGKLFSLSPAPEVGLNLDGLATGTPEPGNEAPSLTPSPMTFNAGYKWYEAEGIPITPFADNKDANGNYVKNFYPTVKVVAKDTFGNVLATTTTVLPVSDEMTCKGCHASNSTTTDAKPSSGWVNDPNLEKDWKRNILRLHDEKNQSDPDQSARTLYANALNKVGYSSNGLLASADSGKPVLCVSCHASNAYFDKRNKKTVMGGLTGLGFVDANGKQLIPPFTQVLHGLHANVKDPTSVPANSLTLNDSNNRTACYTCHPGSKTQCLRGAMGKATSANGNSLMSCQSCHGNMKAVGNSTRQGWIDEPTCESCHNSNAPNRRAISGVGNATNGKPVLPADHTFATNANTPAIPGLNPNLYRFSTGHGGLQCEACHGSTHAEYPSLHADDNTQSIAVQGHAGTVAECTACHKTVPATVNGGPHGMHTTGNSWVKSHQEANKNGTAATPSCAYCHGTTAAGTPLSAIKVAKTINAGDFGTKSWPAGYQVSCFSCHNGPNPD